MRNRALRFDFDGRDSACFFRADVRESATIGSEKPRRQARSTSKGSPGVWGARVASGDRCASQMHSSADRADRRDPQPASSGAFFKKDIPMTCWPTKSERSDFVGNRNILIIGTLSKKTEMAGILLGKVPIIFFRLMYRQKWWHRLPVKKFRLYFNVTDNAI